MIKSNIKNEILTMNRDELKQLSDTIRYRRDELSQEEKDSFKVGDSVYFMHNNQRQYGTITKKNPKKLKVNLWVNRFQSWGVPPSLLIPTERDKNEVIKAHKALNA